MDDRNVIELDARFPKSDIAVTLKGNREDHLALSNCVGSEMDGGMKH
jgi:hypothetical protein